MKDSDTLTVATMDLGGEICPYDGLTTLKNILERQITLTPNAVAPEDTDDKRQLSYEEMNTLADSLADLLRTCFSVCPGSRVCLAVERTVEIMIAMLAILKVGGGYVPLGLRHTDTYLQTMIDDISPSVILCSQSCADRFRKVGVDRLYVVRDDDIPRTLRQAAASKAPAPSAGDNLAYIIFTSGTTGKPKGHHGFKLGSGKVH